MIMKIIKISVENEITEHEYPTGSISKKNQELRELIGCRCEIHENIMPRRLYTELGGSNKVTWNEGDCVSMLVDEEGLYHDLKTNIVGSYLYETDKHGHVIAGNILIVGKKMEEDGIDFCGISDNQFDLLYPQLKKLTERVRALNESF